MEPIVVIGAGVGGLTVARELRQLAPDVAITLVTQDDAHQYPKPMLSTALRLGKRPDDLIRSRAEELRALGIEVLSRRSVVKLAPGERVLTLDDGSTLSYRELVLATGASPFVPEFEGAREAVLTVNHLDDYRRFRDALHAEAPVLLIGGGLIGIEFASDLLASGTDAPFALSNYGITVKVAQWPVATTTPLLGESGVVVHDRGSLSRLLDPDGRLLRVVATGSETPSLGTWLKEVPALSAASPR